MMYHFLLNGLCIYLKYSIAKILYCILEKLNSRDFSRLEQKLRESRILAKLMQGLGIYQF